MKSATDLAAMVRDSRQSAQEALQEHLQVIDAQENDIHAFNAIDREVAMETAASIDEMVASGDVAIAAYGH